MRLGVVLSVLLCLLLADLVTGILHWAEDSYAGAGMAPWLDRWITLDNIRHHERPGTITQGSYWSCNRVCICMALALALICAAAGVTSWQVYLFLGMLSQSNQIHRWAHTRDVPFIVRCLQRVGLLQSRRHHAEHHKNPYSVKFCTTTDWLNPILDAVRFWRALEKGLHFCGVPVKRCTAYRKGF